MHMNLQLSLPRGALPTYHCGTAVARGPRICRVVPRIWSSTLVRKPFLQLVSERVVVLDGSMGANLQSRDFDLKRDWCGHENCCEMLNLSRPEVIRSVHESFLNVGC